MKTVSDDLFQLIRSMSKQEKRYFKLFASRHVIGTQNKYVLLFDAIEKQAEYDENAIRHQFAGEKFLRQLHVAKNYLYGLILNSLRNFHESRSAAPFRLALRNAQLLFDKGLYKQSEKSLAKARRYATEEENFLQLLEAYRWEHQIAHSRNDYDWLETYLTEGIHQEFDILDRHRNFLEFQILNDQVFLPYWKKGTVRSEAEKSGLQQLFERPLFRSAENARSFYARYFYHNARFSYHLFVGELAESYRYIRELVNMLAKQTLKGKLIRYYSSALINLYIVQRQLEKYDEIPTTLEQLREVPTESKEQERRLFVRSFNLEIDFYLHTGQFANGLQKIAPLLLRFERYQSEVNRQQRLGLYYNLAYLYFGAEDFDTALDWINTLLHDPELKTREDIHSFGSLLNLIIHYELGNDQLLEYIVKSTYRFLSSRKRLFKVESIMLKLMRRYPNWIHRQDKEQGFKALIKELQELEKDEFEQKAFEYFNFIAWMESKVHQRSFAETVRLGLHQP
ncbi:MAG: hypothetical protein DHS20C18_42210 [Saprospiraceae bacterium]|nr:MAG: hypothetical protein DHS20C18_42210 [Saprospiraceae bacterium]